MLLLAAGVEASVIEGELSDAVAAPRTNRYVPPALTRSGARRLRRPNGNGDARLQHDPDSIVWSYHPTQFACIGTTAQLRRMPASPSTSYERYSWGHECWKRMSVSGTKRKSAASA
jgi:hypothetical protein